MSTQQEQNPQACLRDHRANTSTQCNNASTQLFLYRQRSFNGNENDLREARLYTPFTSCLTRNQQHHQISESEVVKIKTFISAVAVAAALAVPALSFAQQ